MVEFWITAWPLVRNGRRSPTVRISRDSILIWYLVGLGKVPDNT